MNYQQLFSKLVHKQPQEVFKEFLSLLEHLFSDYLKGKITDEDLSNLTVFWFATNDKFSDGLIRIDKRIKECGRAMDVTQPDVDEKKKKELIKHLLILIEEISKKHRLTQ